MVKVPPGNQTGLYYIVVSNLSWTCTWQRLKDFVKNHPDGTFLNVDHAYVYPGSTAPCSGCGWVRIVGKSDFEKAYTRLNGGVLDGRALVADDRNRENVLTLRDIAPASQPPSRNPQVSTVSAATIGYFTTAPSPVYHNADGLPTSSFSGQENYENWSFQQQAMANYAPPSPAFSTHSSYYQSPQTHESTEGTFQVSHKQEYYTVPTTAVVYVGNMALIYPCMPAATYMHSPLAHINQNANVNTSPPPGTVQPEARKIIITRLSHDTKDSDLSALIRLVCSRYKARTQPERDCPIHSIEMPRYPNNKPKGHAFVVFDSQGLAEFAVSALDRSKFQGRLLSAKLAKEGVEPVGGYGIGNAKQQHYTLPLPPNAGISSGLHKGSSDKTAKEQTLDVSSDSNGKGKKSGSSKSTDESTDVGSTIRDKREKENRQPLVVDGSGRKRR